MQVNKLFLLFISVFLFFTSSYSQDGNLMAEVIEVMENSKITYELNQISKEIESKDQSLNLVTVEFYQIENEGSIVTKMIELSEEEKILKQKAEEYYRSKEYSKARIEYQELLKKQPNYSKIATYIGETYYRENDFSEAMVWFKKSLELNSKNYLSHLFIGRILIAEEGKEEEGLRHLLRAHILNRNAKFQQKELITILGEQGYEYDKSWSFNPQFELIEVKKGKKYEIKFNEEWMGYGLVKTVWTCEKEYRAKRGFGEGEGLVEEEKEALAGYIMSASNIKKSERSPIYSKIELSIDNDKINEFILYEILMREYPQIGIQLPDELLTSIENYILEVRCVKEKVKNKKEKKK